MIAEDAGAEAAFKVIGVPTTASIEEMFLLSASLNLTAGVFTEIAAVRVFFTVLPAFLAVTLTEYQHIKKYRNSVIMQIFRTNHK